MNTASQHLIMDMTLSGKVEVAVNYLCHYIEMTFTVVQKNEKLFEPHGRTVVYILSESHFTVHTYPEHNYISMDIYICNMDINMHNVRKEIEQMLSPIHVRSNLFYRGFLP